MYDWSAWKEGQKLLDNTDTDFDPLDMTTLCKLITLVIRADRFNDGCMIKHFENRNMEKIIRALRKHVENK